MLPANAALRSQVSQLTLNIAVAKARLADMKAELVRAQRQLDSITYPVLSLPTEIVSEIFICCLPTPNTRQWTRRVDGIDSKQAPLLLSQICCQWRRIALSTSALWKRLDINLRRRQRRACIITETWLERAHSSPLSVRLHGPTGDLVDPKKFSETFHRYAPGIRSLEFDIFQDDLKWGMMARSIDLPLLRRLSFRLVDGDAGLPESSRVEMFKNVPQLSQVLFHQVLPEVVVLPWQQLTRFTGELYLPPECQDALRLMPNLEECAFSVIETHANYSHLEVLSHQQIRSFTLFHSTSHHYAEARSMQILQFLALPKLESLELLDVNYDDWFILEACFENGPTPPLKRLVVRPQSGKGRTGLPLTVALFLQPHLTDLEIWHPDRGFTSDFFDSLGHNSAFMPGLEKLVFYCRYREDEASQADLLGIAAEPIQRRRVMAGVAQLRVFHAVLVGDVYVSPWERDIDLFRELKAEGLDVYIGSEGGDNEI
ncbi:hypothetical protein FB45DRAFT_425602 [Roridomyces roridus]|uniref:F-box domain-containing protein n=1 Tax=Roridomyces roridus TaxID=1738132 RepID=A0AAD7C7H3_9AGAR|nr:hypothetical protein FB45DRAFT_425602 [Roridomyces roridus]